MKLRFLALGTATLAVVALIVVLGVDRGYVAPRIRMHAGTAWVASTRVGHLTLLDGPSGEVAARVEVAAPGSQLTAGQDGATGYGANRADGSVTRIDGTTLAKSAAITPVQGARTGLAIFPTEHVLYAVDTQRGLLTRNDPQTLISRGDVLPLAAQVTPEGAAVDSTDRLWVVDQQRGELVWVTDGQRHTRAGAGTPQHTRLTTVDGQPVLVDPVQGKADLLDPATGEISRTLRLDLREDDRIAVSGSAGRLLVSVGSRGLFMACSFETESCAPPIPLGPDKADLGAPATVGSHAVIPNYLNGKVWVVDLDRMTVVAERDVLSRPGRFDLFSRDGIVFYNDPDSEKAGVIDLDGTVRPMDKYDPVHPENGVTEVPDHDRKPNQPPPSGPPNQNPVDAGKPPDSVPPVPGPGTTLPIPGVPPTSISILLAPTDHGQIGDEFTLTVVTQGTASVLNAQWSFGDGKAGSGSTTKHLWDRPGTFQVTATATLTSGETAISPPVPVTIDAPEAPPRIVRVAVTQSPQVGEQVRFSAEVSGSTPEQWTWTVTGPRGTETTSNTSEFQYTFTTPGTYTAALTVSKARASDQKSAQVIVVPVPKCGDTILASVTLRADLSCDNDFGLKIGASNVVLDLGGHRISNQNEAGLVIAGPTTINSTTVRNGRITGGHGGFRMQDVNGVTGTGLTIIGAFPGHLEGDRARNVVFSGVTVGPVPRNFTYAAQFRNGSSVSFNAGSAVHGYAFTCESGGTCNFLNSSVDLFGLYCGAGVMPSVLMRNTTISVTEFGSGCNVRLENNPWAGITYLDTSVGTFTGNTFTGGSMEIRVGQINATGNTFRGVFFYMGRGVLSNNTFRGGKSALWLDQIAEGATIGPLTISGNLFTQATSVGGSPGDGLTIDLPPGPAIIVTGNTASDNARYGICVQSGTVVDGGGNVSINNPSGCQGVSCS
jgi:PKD repeat protein